MGAMLHLACTVQGTYKGLCLPFFSEFVMSVSSPASSDWTLFLLVAAVVALALSLIHYLEVMRLLHSKERVFTLEALGVRLEQDSSIQVSLTVQV